jgi:type IV pilus assembly protein PilW
MKNQTTQLESAMPRTKGHMPMTKRAVARQRGLSLTELLVAMTISLFIVIALITVYSSIKSGFSYTNNTVRLSEDASYALDMIGRDIRMTAFAGCTGSNFTVDASTPPVTTYTPKFNLISGQTISTANLKPNPFAGVITGNLSDVFTSKNAVWGFAANNTAAIGVLGGGSSSYTVSTTAPMLYLAGGSAQAIQVSSAVAAVTDDIAIPSDTYSWANNVNPTYMIIADCKGSEIFKATAFTSGAGTIKTIAHGGGAGENNSASLVNTYSSDALVMPLISSIYFLATRVGRTVPSLYRRHFNGSIATVEELVENVETIVFHYGVNTTNTGGGEPTYITDIYDTDPTAVTDWSRVVSVRMGLVMVSEESGQTTASGQSVPWLGGTLTPDSVDRRVRRAYSTTVSIRNRMGL